MKTVAVLLLLFMLLTVVYGAGKGPENKKGRCPQLIDFIMGKECTDPCTSDSQCPGTEKCCRSDGGPACQQCMEPQEETPETMCRIGCPRVLLPVCGSDGVSYGNDCMLRFITCSRNQGFIELVHEGNCKPEQEIELPAPSKCQEQGVDSTCKEKRDQVRKSGLIGAYVPQCDDQGFYQPKQCHASTGYCWCADCSGKELTKRARPTLDPW